MIDLTAIREAEKDLTELHDAWAMWVPENGSHAHKLLQAVGTALACLRECAERREGCEFCTPAPNERIEIQCSRIGRTSWPDYETAGRIDGHALLCPKCGRKLERSDT